jgi:hypothetical protein
LRRPAISSRNPPVILVAASRGVTEGGLLQDGLLRAR